MVHAKHRFGGAWKTREIRDKVKMWMVGHINDILMCNDLQPWNVIDIIAEGNYRIFPQCRAAINGCAKVDRTLLDYFQLSFPCSWLMTLLLGHHNPQENQQYANELFLCYD